MTLGLDPFLAQIIIVPFNFAPKGWASCNGQLMPISQNTALFSLLGTTYGGDGKSTFALPDLRGRVAIHPGQGPGLSYRDLGETGGVSTVALLTSEIPLHTHDATIQLPAGGQADTDNPVNAFPGIASEDLYSSVRTSNLGTFRSNLRTQPNGGSLPHNNTQPSLVLHYVIALQGIFPQRP